jgi:hypothetical protein
MIQSGLACKNVWIAVGDAANWEKALGKILPWHIY